MPRIRAVPMAVSWNAMVDRVPLAVAYGLLAVTYWPYVKLVVIDQVILAYRQTALGLLELAVYHALLFMSGFSLFLASTRSPGYPSDAYVRESRAERDVLERGSEEARFRGREEPLGPRTNGGPGGMGGDEVEDEQDVPLSEVMERKRASADRLPHDDREENGPLSLAGILASEPPPGINAYPPRGRVDVGGIHGLAAQGLLSKATTGERRWCRKCDAAKPDRCHHCRQCGRCVLKMDHHCVWLNNCVGYGNHKPFLLFLLYTPLLAVWVAATSAQVVVWFFRDPDAADEVVDFTPVAWLILVMLGCVFGLSIGGFAVYHAFLVSNNKTTLESMTRNVPAVTLPPRPRTSNPPPDSPTPPAYARRASLDVPKRDGTRWRADHELSRDERRRAKRVAEETNLFDLGRKRNWAEVMDVEQDDGAEERGVLDAQEDAEGLLSGRARSSNRRAGRSRAWRYALWLWPATRARLHASSGHTFAHNPTALVELQHETARLRLGDRHTNDPPQYESTELYDGHEPDARPSWSDDD